MTATVRVHVVTFRRPHLLERALRSLLAQTHRAWIAEVLNDDPADHRVADLIARLGDPRIQISTPPLRRGGTGNFNHAFRAVPEPFASILEDDNWWEPSFLATMLATLERHPTATLACGNERIWREQSDGTWLDTQTTIWPASFEPSLFPFRLLDKCGSAKLCNSSLLFRTRGAEAWRTPAEIPIDVTEHFRERVVPHPVLLVPQPLVNYGETLHTHRARGAGAWGEYQSLLIGSVFTLIPPALRLPLANTLWSRARAAAPWSATPLLATGRFHAAARPLWSLATPREKLGFIVSASRHPRATLNIARAPQRHAAAWQFLQQGAFADFARKSTSVS